MAMFGYSDRHVRSAFRNFEPATSVTAFSWHLPQTATGSIATDLRVVLSTIKRIISAFDLRFV